MRTRYFQTRQSLVPKDAVEITREGIDAVIYTYTDNLSRPYAIAFGGKRNRPDWHFSFRSEESRTRKIEDFFAGQQAHAQLVQQRRSQGPSEVARRNAAIKKLLETRYGKGKVRITKERGTAYGWVDVRIAAPCPEGKRPFEAHSDVVRMILDAGIKLSLRSHLFPAARARERQIRRFTNRAAPSARMVAWPVSKR